MKFLRVIFIFVYVLFSSSGVFAVNGDEDNAQYGYYPGDDSLSNGSVVVPFFGNVSIDLFSGFDVQVGYDNNVNLDSKRNKDGFSQIFYSGEISSRINDQFSMVGGVDVYDITYFKYNTNNLVDISPYIGIEYYIFPHLVWKNYCIFDHFAYPNNKESTFSEVGLETALRHDISESTYHEISFRHMARYYPDQKISLVNNNKGNDDRSDVRNMINYTAGTFIFQSALLRLSNGFQFTDSNYMYQEYYDYWAYRCKPSVMYFFTDNIYADCSVLYKYKDYKDRRRSEDINSTVQDHMFIYNLSLYYDISDNVTLGFNYSYTENYPNDPFLKFSGSVVSGGVYLTF